MPAVVPVAARSIVKPELEAEPQPEPEPDPALSLSQLLSTDGVLDWHDAVALVQQISDTLFPDKSRPAAGSIPPIDSITLESSGRMNARLGPAAAPESPAKGLGRLLLGILQDRPAPANLRLLAWQAASESPIPLSLVDLGRQLAHWERPGRLATLSDIYARGSGAAPAIKVVEAEPVPAIEDLEPIYVPQLPRIRPRRRYPIRTGRYLALAGAWAVFAFVVAFGAVLVFDREVARPAVQPVVRITPTDLELPAPVKLSKAEEQKRRAALALAARQPRPNDDPAPERKLTAPRAATAPAPPVAAAPQPAVTHVADVASAASAPLRETPVSSMPPPRETPARLSPPAAAAADESVEEPPVLVRPYLPIKLRAGTPSDKVGVLEILVDARGRVESVHLNSPDNRYRERWWLFSAKDWQFKPAMKDGKPVKFLTRIPLTDLNMLEPQ